MMKEPKPPANYWVRVNRAQIDDACVVPPCCAGDCDHGCVPYDARRAAIEAGYVQGVRHAAAMIAHRIRAELVCCPAELIDRWSDALTRDDDERHIVGFHDICYWSEMSARLAEDPHSLLVSPYECMGGHPGECWSPTPCEGATPGNP